MEKDPPWKHAYDPVDPTGASGVSVDGPAVVRCPVCKSADFDARSTQFAGIVRNCRKCKNEWSGGGVGSFPDGAIPPPAELPAEDDAYPIVQFTGGPHRRFGDDE